jgi:sec-independent protein translocase protein TatA
MRLGRTEIIVIVVVAFLLFWGVAKLSGLGKALGKSIKDFRNEVKAEDGEEGNRKDKADGGSES